MAAFGLVIVERFKPLRGVRRGLVDITFDATYISGGWVVTPAMLGLKECHLRLPAGINESGILIAWNDGETVFSGGTISAVATVGGAALTNQADALVVRGEYVGV